MAVIHGARPVVAESSTAAVQASTRRPAATRYVLAALRVVVGWVFLWAFLDKLFGLGYSTPSAKAWLNGGSPTKGFLTSSTGPFAGFYHGIAGAGWANVLFMLGLAGLGVALMLGIGMRIAAVGGTILYLMMFSVALPPTTNPLVDDHIIGVAVVVLLALCAAGDTFGLGRWWKSLPLVQRNPWLS